MQPGADDPGPAPWEFDTVRGNLSLDLHTTGDTTTHATFDTASSPNPTIRPPPSKVPSTLRMLFEDSDAPAEPLKLPGFDPPHASLTPGLLPPVSHPRSRGRSCSAASHNDEHDEDILTAKQPTFEFPPRTSTPRATQNLTSLSDVDDNNHAWEKLPPLGPGIPRGVPIGSAKSSGPESPALRYRELRSERGVTDIEIPSPHFGQSARDSSSTPDRKSVV